MSALTSVLTNLVSEIFIQCDLPAELGQVNVSDRPDLAQFQCNGAMAAAKIAKKAPRQIAEDIVAKLKERTEFSSIEIAGPGFINLNVTDAFLQNHLKNVVMSDKFGISGFGAGQTIVLDYGGPNLGKPMHVGHLRTAIIGDSLRRILSYVGYKTLADVHMGDWGTPMGMIISELEMRHPDWPYFDPNFTGPYPDESPLTIKDFEELYPTASKNCKADPERHAKAQAATLELQNGRAGYTALWKHFTNVSVDSMKDNYGALNVHFDLWKGESDAHAYIEPMVKDLTDKNLATESNGAIVIHVEHDDDNKEMPPLILYKSDGAVMYGTTDLATIIQRMGDYTPDKIVYVVDQRQHLHFEQVFRAAKLSNITKSSTELVHAGFGTMNGEDGTPFKTRDGGVIKLNDFLKMTKDKSLEKLNESNIGGDLSDSEKQEIASNIGLSAIKFADLQNNRIADYVFDLDRLTSFEGKTGPYILYQAVRIKSLLRKAAAQGDTAGNSINISEHNKSLALLMSEFPDVLDGTCRNYSPHILADYVYRLAQGFGSFYNNCHILSEENADMKASHLTLCKLVNEQLEVCMGLLGIETPERM